MKVHTRPFSIIFFVNMDAFKILFALCVSYLATADAGPLKRFDQRQDGDLNIQAHLDKIVLLIIPNKNINILDIKGQGQFDNYEDILPLLGKESAAVNEVKFKLAAEDSKIKAVIVPESKEEKKEAALPKTEPKIIEQKEQKEFKKPAEVRETTPKKVDNEAKTVPETPKKTTSKLDGRTYQTVHLGNNRERVVAVSSQDIEARKADTSTTKSEKL